MAALMAAKLLLLLSIQGVAASSIYFTDITMYSSNNSFSGLAAVNVSGMLGYICDTTGTAGGAVPTNNVLVICNQYGYAYGRGYLTDFPQTGTVILKDPDCIGTETDIMDCPGSVSGTYSTTSYPNGAYWIMCHHPYNDMYTNMQLVGGNSTMGSVELRATPSGTWHPVCGDSTWDKSNREVACRQLGYNSSKEFNYQTGSGTTFVKSPKCEGNENNLTQCADSDRIYNTFTSYSCEAAGLACADPIPEYTFNYDWQEIYVNGYWERFCGQSLTTDNAQIHVAHAICKSLGRTYSQHYKELTLFEPSTTQLRYMVCSLEAKNLNQCSILKAPAGKGFLCYDKMKVVCKDENDNNFRWENILSWGGNVLRFGLPLLILFGGGIITLIIRAKKKKRMQGQVPQGGQVAGIATVSTGAASGGYRSGYPLQLVAGQGYPAQPQPAPTAPAAQYNAPPSYQQTTYTDWSRPTVTATTNDDSKQVPGAAQYTKPNMPKQYSWE